METTSIYFEILGLTNHIFHCAVSKLGHNLSNIFCHEHKIIDDMLRLPCELAPELFILSCDTNWASIQMAFTHHDTTNRNQRSCSKSEFFSSKQACNDNISSSFKLTVCLKLDAISKTIQNKRLLSFSKAKFPWKPSSLQTCPSSSACPTIVATYGDMIRKSLCNTSRDNTNANFRYKFYRNFAIWLSILKIVNKLSKIFNGVDIVMRWW
mmetsp:Transcript_12263/g.17990  ORF Transcript_12263/g.17990 Transcript_12263/m.17990 type:complete len:210 (+) Transcript_12263:1000-1629(+)